MNDGKTIYLLTPNSIFRSSAYRPLPICPCQLAASSRTQAGQVIRRPRRQLTGKTVVRKGDRNALKHGASRLPSEGSLGSLFGQVIFLGSLHGGDSYLNDHIYIDLKSCRKRKRACTFKIYTIWTSSKFTLWTIKNWNRLIF